MSSWVVSGMTAGSSIISRHLHGEASHGFVHGDRREEKGMKTPPVATHMACLPSNIESLGSSRLLISARSFYSNCVKVIRWALVLGSSSAGL